MIEVIIRGNNKPINVSYNGLGTEADPNSKDL